MAELFCLAVLGHLVADYLLQPKKMALQKSAKGLTGSLWCLAHCLIYTVCVCAFIGNWSWLALGLVFASHYPVDRYSLASWWLRLIHGRDILEAHQNIGSQHREVDIAFACLVYTVTDNTIHLLALWWIVNFVR